MAVSKPRLEESTDRRESLPESKKHIIIKKYVDSKALPRDIEYFLQICPLRRSSYIMDNPTLNECEEEEALQKHPVYLQ